MRPSSCLHTSLSFFFYSLWVRHHTKSTHTNAASAINFPLFVSCFPYLPFFVLSCNHHSVPQPLSLGRGTIDQSLSPFHYLFHFPPSLVLQIVSWIFWMAKSIQDKIDCQKIHSKLWCGLLRDVLLLFISIWSMFFFLIVNQFIDILYGY